ncbi:MAG: primosomal protein N' [Bacilli bacterium]
MTQLRVGVVIETNVPSLDRVWDYVADDELFYVEPGMRVAVPFGGQPSLLGVVIRVEPLEQKEGTKYKSIHFVLDERPVLTPELLTLAETISHINVSSFGRTVFTMLPQALKTIGEMHYTLADAEAKFALPFDLQLYFDEHETFKEGENHGVPVDRTTLNRLVKERLLVRHISMKNKGTIQYDLEVHLVSDSPAGASLRQSTSKRDEPQRRIVSFLEQNGPTEQKILLGETKTNRGTLMTLVKKGIVVTRKVERYRAMEDTLRKRTEPRALTTVQVRALERIHEAMGRCEAATCLIHGITGSGKTEVYLQTIADVLARGLEAIVLVPEIALTPQMVSQFKSRFGNAVAVLHSGLSIGEKYDEWRKIAREEVQVVVGARSAIFAPFKRLGAIIIDEEHETTYKQTENPRYDAREVAILRARAHGAIVLLGSATPSFESYARASKGVYTLIEMRERANARPLPAVEIVDMREELRNGNMTMFSVSLQKAIEETLLRGEQMVIFLNRRGHSSFVMCRSCGLTMKCEKCDVSMTYHHADQSLHCHYCGESEQVPTICPSCQSDAIRYFGVGTERVELELNRMFPQLRVIRMDQDTTRKKGAHEALIGRFERGEADCLLGTQMIAKGLDFPRVTLVGVLTADGMLGLPDFRAAERTFSLLTQVSGRAGRHELPGRTIIQTYNPEHPAVELAATGNYPAFYASDMANRRAFRYPPYVYIIYIVFSHEDLRIVMRASASMAETIRQYVAPDTIVVGASACPISRINEKYRYGIMIKYRHDPALLPLLHKVYHDWMLHYEKEQLSINIDHHPTMMM